MSGTVLANEMTLRQLQIINGDICAGESVFQFYIISNPEFLLRFTDELVFYDDPAMAVVPIGQDNFINVKDLIPLHISDFHE